MAKGKTVFNMMRKVHTAYGESDDLYTSVGEDLMHGECQGTNSSPSSWAIYTIRMLRALGKFNPGVTVRCVEAIKVIHRLADFFVDDVDMWTESNASGDKEEIMKLLNNIRKASQAWERILFASEGLLALHKCYWWMVGWKWDNGMPVMLNLSEIRCQLTIRKRQRHRQM